MARVTDASGRPTSGQVSVPVVAIVVDNKDPDELGRIKVKFPSLPEEPVSTWLRQVSPNAGSGGGLYALPEIDDEVLVVFLHGNQNHGVVVGQFWNGVTLPPPEAKDGMPGSSKTDTGGKLSTDGFKDGSTNIDENDRRFWLSRSGHLFAMDDTSGKETLQIWDSSRQLVLAFDSADGRIVLANTNKDIHIRAKRDLVFEAGRDVLYQAGRHLKGESSTNTEMVAKGKFMITSDMDASMESGMNLNLKGDLNVAIEAGVNLKVEGTMVGVKASAQGEFNGGGMAKVAGGVVMIN